MKNKNNMLDLLTALSEDLSTEDLRFADIASNLAVQITAKRIEMGLTQHEFAELLGRSQTTVSKWENADCNFQIKTLIDISQKLDLPLTISFKDLRPAPNIYFVSPTPEVISAAASKYYTSPHTDWISG